jgi:mono/diheme cytochrome c family protein
MSVYAFSRFKFAATGPLAASLILIGFSACTFAEAPAPSNSAYFEQFVRPILATNCIKCHGPAKQKGKLRLDSRGAMLAGGGRGTSLVPGNPTESLFLRAIRHEDLKMPPDEHLAAADIERLEQWVAAGAPWPENGKTLRENTGTITDADRAWWAFRPLSKPEVPPIDADTWSVNSVDKFVYRKLLDNEMKPAPAAEKSVLARRLYFDLVGMPPTTNEVDRFLNDTSPNAWEALIDRLLDDPRYGEHWARFWLDLVRYAESDGWKADTFRPNLWRYRDYVVNAFNADKPYTEFVREQLAGDEMPGDDPAHIVATGYLRLGIFEYNQRDAKPHWNDIINEITDVTGSAFFGLSMSCSRCHDHKFDPILQTDYFNLRAFFEPLLWKDDVIAATSAEKAAWQEKNAAWEQASAEVRAQIDAISKPYIERKRVATADRFPLEIQAAFHKPPNERMSWDQQMCYLVERQVFEEQGGPFASITEDEKTKLAALQMQLAEFDSVKPKPLPAVMAVCDFTGPISPTAIQGHPDAPPAQPRFLCALSREAGGDIPQIQPVANSTGRRTALAEWITRPDNSLTARVIVNRIWQQHFGDGIVRSSSDFGRLGEPPTHPELLDWLTTTFVERGWHFKALHKMILMSSTWQQSAAHSDAENYTAKDPTEKLLWRWKVRRLKAEQVRDAMLLASGELDERIGGPSVDAPTPRRALYVRAFRNNPDDFLYAFDAANGLTSVAERTNTTTPTQALLMVNGGFTLACATKMAERVRDGRFQSRADALDYAFRLAWGREPTFVERARAVKFIGLPPTLDSPIIDHEKLVDLCHVLLNSNEFLYLD